MLEQIGVPPIPPSVGRDESKYKTSPSLYPEPPWFIFKKPLASFCGALLSTTTSTVAPCQGAVDGCPLLSNNFTL